LLDIEPFSAEQRRFFGARAAAVRVLDSFIQHAKKLCWCYDARRESEPVVSTGTDSEQEAADDMVVVS